MGGKLLRAIQEKYRTMCNILDEPGRRVWAAAEAKSLPFGGVSLVSKATGMSRTTIHAALREVGRGPWAAAPRGRSRQRGGGRKPLVHHQPDLLEALDDLVEPTTRGDPESPLRWTCKSTRHLAAELRRQGYPIGDRKVADLLHQMRYSLQANAKTIEGTPHPDRHAQFEYLNAQARAFLRRGLPVISVDTKKKELVGNFKNAGREWQPQGQPEKALVHDFEDKELGKVIPDGVAPTVILPRLGKSSRMVGVLRPSIPPASKPMTGPDSRRVSLGSLTKASLAGPRTGEQYARGPGVRDGDWTIWKPIRRWMPSRSASRASRASGRRRLSPWGSINALPWFLWVPLAKAAPPSYAATLAKRWRISPAANITGWPATS